MSDEKKEEVEIVWRNRVKFRDGTYNGQFKGDLRYGQGNFRYSDGRQYHGEWKNDKRDGQGILLYKDGQSYTGEFKNGLRHGIGVFKNFAGVLETQEFEKGKGVKVEEIEEYSKNYFDGGPIETRTGWSNSKRGIPMSPISSKDHSGKHPRTNPCPYVRAAWNFLELHLGMDTKWFRFDWNVCFCPRCEFKFNRKTGKRGDKLYAFPIGWTKFGLPVPPFFGTAGSLDNWHVGFHGTKGGTAKIIIEQSRGGLLLPGDVAPSGFVLPVVNPLEGRDEKWQKQLFLSPSMIYCEEVYTPDVVYNGEIFRVAFQVRIEPGTYKEGPQTIKKEEVIDPLFDNDKIEWYTPRRNVAVLSGLLVKRIFDGVAIKREKEEKERQQQQEEEEVEVVEEEEEEEEGEGEGEGEREQGGEEKKKKKKKKEENEKKVVDADDVGKMKKMMEEMRRIIESQKKEIEERKKIEEELKMRLKEKEKE